MRISDWSSDVCSSDLIGLLGLGTAQPRQRAMHPERQRLWKIATQLALLGLQVLMVQRDAGRIAIGHDRYGKALLVRLNPSRTTASRSFQWRSFLAGVLQVGKSAHREMGWRTLEDML